MRAAVMASAVALAAVTLTAADRAPLLLDVIATDARGADVTTLTAADFGVTEDGTPVTVRDLRFIRPTAATEADARVFAFFLDDFHVTPGPGADRARDALVQFVRALSPSDLIAVLKPLDSVLSIRVSADREAAAAAIAAFAPRRGDYTPRSAFERDFIATAPGRAEASRAQISANALSALVTQLGRLPQPRKSVLLLSEGFQPPRRRGEEFVAGFTGIAISANRHRVALYPLDPRASDPPPDSSDAKASAEGLVRLAEETNGAWVSSPRPEDALERMRRDASGYYVLTIEPSSERRDGRLHPVSTAVRRPGVTLRARRGYWSQSPLELEPAAMFTAAPVSPVNLVPRRTSTMIRPWFGMSRDENGQTQVNFVWEPAPRIPGERTNPGRPERITFSAMTPDGESVFEGVVLPSAGVPADASLSRQSQATFATTAPRLLIQMSIEDAGRKVIDRDVRDLTLTRFSGAVTIGSAQFFRSRTARDFATLSNNLEAAPVAARAFSRAERLLIRVPVSAPDAATVTARLVSPLGGRLRDLSVQPIGQRPGLYQFDILLAGLPAGIYTIEIAARAGTNQVLDSLPFRITP